MFILFQDCVGPAWKTQMPASAAEIFYWSRPRRAMLRLALLGSNLSRWQHNAQKQRAHC